MGLWICYHLTAANDGDIGEIIAKFSPDDFTYSMRMGAGVAALAHPTLLIKPRRAGTVPVTLCKDLFPFKFGVDELRYISYANAKELLRRHQTAPVDLVVVNTVALTTSSMWMLFEPFPLSRSWWSKTAYITSNKRQTSVHFIWSCTHSG